MATANDAPHPQTPPPPPPPSTAGSAALPSGEPLWLFWGGAMLLLFALWLQNGYADTLGTAVPNVFWVLGLAGCLIAIWQFLVIRKARRLSDVTVLARQRRLTGVLLIAAGIALAGLALYLALKLGLAGFNVWAGLGLFTIVPLAGGSTFLRPPTTTTDFVREVLKRHALLQNVLLLLGVVGMVVFIWLAFVATNRKVTFDWLPELAALLFESLLCATCAFWIMAAKPAERTEFSFRCLLLIAGAGTGFILTMLAATRALVWRQDVFGGMAAWNSDAVGWKFWPCAYLGLIGLSLMFASVLLALPEIRNHPLLRQSLYGYNAVVSGVLVIVMLITLNIVVYAMFPMTFEWAATRGGLSSLHPASKSLLASLKEPVTVYVLMSQHQRLFSEVQSMMSNSQVQTNKLSVHYISPDSDFKEFGELAQRFPEILPSAREAATDESAGGRGILILYGPPDAPKVPHSFIPERKLFDRQEFDPQTQKQSLTLVFKGEVEFMNELDFLTRGKQERQLYFLQGDQELDINARGNPRHLDAREPMAKFGAAKLVERLKKDNYKVNGLSFDRKPEKSEKSETTNIIYLGGSDVKPAIPKEAFAVVIAGPSEPLSAECLDALGDYVDKGGKLFVTFDIILDPAGKALRKTGLETFLRKYGVDVEDRFLMRYGPEDPRTVVVRVSPNLENELGKQFALTPFFFTTTRVIKAVPAPKFKSEVFMESVFPKTNLGVTLVETNPQYVLFPTRFIQGIQRHTIDVEPRIPAGPVSVAVTVSTDAGKPRMVVVGDTDFISNGGLAPNEEGDQNYSLFVSTLEWMAERKGYQGPRPTVTQSYSLSRDAPLGRMVLLPTWGMFLVTIGLGIGVWLVRRR